MREIHEGDCDHHTGSKSLVAKAFRHGFYWLMAHANAEDLVKRYDGCQKFSRRAHVPAQELRMIPITWPFATWGLDMVGPFKRSKDKKTHLLVAVDKFTKCTTKKYTCMMIRVCHSRSCFFSCMYIHDDFMAESR